MWVIKPLGQSWDLAYFREKILTECVIPFLQAARDASGGNTEYWACEHRPTIKCATCWCFHFFFRSCLAYSGERGGGYHCLASCNIYIYKRVGLCVCVCVCLILMSYRLPNHWTELLENWHVDYWPLSEGFRGEGNSKRSKVKVQVIKRSKTYFCHNTLSFRPIHMKSTPKCSLFNSLSLIWWQMWRWRRYALYRVVCMYLCMLPTLLKNTWTELHEIFRGDLSSSKDQLTRFWEQSGQRSRSRSRRSQKLLDRIAWNFQGWFVII